jgi:hypothetical protein
VVKKTVLALQPWHSATLAKIACSVTSVTSLSAWMILGFARVTSIYPFVGAPTSLGFLLLAPAHLGYTGSIPSKFFQIAPPEPYSAHSRREQRDLHCPRFLADENRHTHDPSGLRQYLGYRLRRLTHQCEIMWSSPLRRPVGAPLAISSWGVCVIPCCKRVPTNTR